jgi:thiamine biosynthesis protein ThiS
MIGGTRCQTGAMQDAETKTIEVVVNGESRRVPEGLNVSSLLSVLGVEGSRVAVELNRQIVRRADWDSTMVSEGAAVEVVWFVGGG